MIQSIIAFERAREYFQNWARRMSAVAGGQKEMIMKNGMNARETRIRRKTRQRRRKIRNLPMMADAGKEYLPSPPEIIEIPNSEFYEEVQDYEDEEGEKEVEKEASASNLDLQAVSSMPPLTDPMPPVKESAWYRFTHWIGERMERFFLL